MIIGVGTDICAITRIQDSRDKRGEKLVDKHFSVTEKQAYQTVPDMARAAYIAKRWAGKEAVAKALGTGIRDGITLSSISILNHENGAPYVELTGPALKQLEMMTPAGYEFSVHISLSDDADMALAFVVIDAHKKDD